MDEKGLEARLILAVGLLLFTALPSGPAAAAESLTWLEANKQSAALLKENKPRPAARMAQRAFDLYSGVTEGYDVHVHAQLLLNSMDAWLKAADVRSAVTELERGADSLTERNKGQPPAVLVSVYEVAFNFTDGHEAERRRVFERASDLSDRILGANDFRSVLLLVRWASEIPDSRSRARLTEARRRAVGAAPAFLAVIDLAAARLETAEGDWRTAIEAYQKLIAGLEARNDPHERATLQSAYAQLMFVHGRIEQHEEAARVREKLGRTFGSADGNLKPLFRVEPAWPRGVHPRSPGDTVVVELTIAEDGTVRDAQVLHATDPDFVSPSLEAVRKWTFVPQIVDGKPVVQKGTQQFDFTSR